LNSTPSDKKTPVLIDIFATLREIVEDDEFRCGCPVNYWPKCDLIHNYGAYFVSPDAKDKLITVYLLKHQLCN